MNPKFRECIEQLEPKYQELVSMEPVKVTSLPKDMPERGVYVFYKGGEPLYVGRSNRMRRRIQEHSWKSVKDAPFAFRIAREATEYTEATYQKQGSRKDLLSKPEFREAFAKAKARIREMEVCFVEESNQTRQALLEIYVALVLNTEYNDFETH